MSWPTKPWPTQPFSMNRAATTRVLKDKANGSNFHRIFRPTLKKTMLSGQKSPTADPSIWHW